MTTAIEQAKREMYLKFNDLYLLVMTRKNEYISCKIFESSLEAYLEQLRQQYEEMASTAHSRFESIQSLEAANQELAMKNETQRHIIEEAGGTNELSYQLAKMTESRDMFRNLHQAATHAAIDRAGQASTSGQTSGDRASCEQPDAKTMAILGVVVDCQQLVSDLAVYGYRAKKQMKKLAYVLNNNPELTQAMKSFEKPAEANSFRETMESSVFFGSRFGDSK